MKGNVRIGSRFGNKAIESRPGSYIGLRNALSLALSTATLELSCHQSQVQATMNATLKPGSGGVVITPEMQRILDQPGYLKIDQGGQKLRNMYSDRSYILLHRWHSLRLAR